MKSLALFLSVGISLFGSHADQVRDPFPDEFVAHPCAQDHCETYQRHQFPELSLRFRGVTLPTEWLDRNWDELTSAFSRHCAKAASCYATADNTSFFCNDLLQVDLIGECSRWDRKDEQWRLCENFARIWSTGFDARSRGAARKAQACADDGEGRTLEVWTVPEKLTPDFKGTFIVHALDAETNLPVMARITTDEGVRLKQEGAPGGRPITSLPLFWPMPLPRVPNAAGHTDLSVPRLIVQAKGYETVILPIPYEVPQLTVTMEPAALKAGRNTILVSAHDAATGEPAELRVMAGDRVAGVTNVPFELDVRGPTMPEIWITSLFDRYSDVIVAPAR